MAGVDNRSVGTFGDIEIGGEVPGASYGGKGADGGPSEVAERHEEKLLIVQAMFGVASADGDITPGRLQSLIRAQPLLGLDEAEFQRAVAATDQWLS